MITGSNRSAIQAVVLGIISGMRATVAPAIAAHYLSKQSNSALKNSRLRFIQSPVAAVVTKLLTTGEVIVDKLPSTGNRIIAKQLLARVVTGAFAGAVVSTANKDDISKGILIGGAAALAATYASFFLRKYIGENSSLKDPITGALEDAVAIGSGILLMK